MSVWHIVLIQLVTFAGLVMGLRVIFSRQLNVALQRLRVLQEEALIKESQLKQELERAKAEGATEVRRGKDEARVLVEGAQQDAEAMRLKTETQAKQDTEKILAHGKEELRKLRVTLLSEMEAEALRLSTKLVAHLLTQDGQAEFQRHLTKGLIADIGRLDRDRFAGASQTVTVTSSVPLTDEERRQLREVLSEKTGRAVALTECLEPRLIAGLVIQLGDLVIDGSLTNKLRRTIPLIQETRTDVRPSPPQS